MSKAFDFTLPDMTCGHCASRIRTLIADIDAGATVDIDLASHRIRIESSLDPEVFRTALIAEDYPPA
ncbi:heavy-metal-associated domain-containing protein [Methyloversatilis sp.]|uniref:heavy-metal-associated domain-containing protein n=1 Tax=Methyloversatilis sp. TaxID=2569862 RepID=UPI0035B49FED